MSAALTAYLRILRAGWRWMLWGVLLALAAATVMLVLQPPMYQSHATVFVRTPGDVSRVVDGGDTYARERAATYAQLAKSTTLADRVIADLNLDVDPATLSARITGKNPPGTALIALSVGARSGTQAHQLATVFLSEYAEMVRSLESVPGLLVPRAELVVVDPPGLPTRMVSWGLPLLVVLSGAVLIGLVSGAGAAVIRAVLAGTAREDAERRG
ncbi:YveK family protein [Mycolicibacterium diernhoferi]|uniref:Cell shape-determining protein n=2 Tax=Mycolicibacterium diernhoferi TaxID=1801 RepID=A0A1Q4HDC1_9MYCO|nr:Wzz/FepE/Etk N-terminal domain-containing protein [Mycolicibacterium diernhoferi]OJZ65536.1 cell shape-determining protein [Mycolicibacterium diernhoferi]OPE53681.1 cell shape-determining protein [Mycolicibacterium diernhoferi]